MHIRSIFKSAHFVILSALVVAAVVIGVGGHGEQVLGQGRGNGNGGQIQGNLGNPGSGQGSDPGNVNICPVQTDSQGNTMALCTDDRDCIAVPNSQCRDTGVPVGVGAVQCKYCVPRAPLPCEITETCPVVNPPPPHAFDFSISNNGPVSFNYDASASGNSTGAANVTLTLVDTPPATVNLTVANPPGTSITGSFSAPATCNPLPNNPCTKSLTINVPGQTAPGAYAIRVTGTSGSLVRATDVVVNVVPVAIPVDCAPDTTPTAKPLCGFAWGGTDEGSSTGVGWLSFNSSDIPGSPQDYKVTVSSADGSLKGCAWSPNIGWVKFGSANGEPLSDNPRPTGNQTVTAKFSSNNNSSGQTNTSLLGWARACSGTVNAADGNLPGNCSSMAPRGDGWDGWISLKNPVTITNGTVKFNGGIFSGYSWGGEVVGWMNWGPVAGIAGSGVHYCGIQIPEFVLTGPEPLRIAPGESGVAPITLSNALGGAPFPDTVSLSVESISSSVVTSADFTDSTCYGPPTPGPLANPCVKDLGIDVAANATDGATANITVRATAGSVSQVVVVQVIVDTSTGGGGDLDLQCDDPDSPPNPNPQTVYVNKPVTFSLHINNTSAEPAFFYSTDGSEPDQNGGSSSNFSVNQTFTTVGKKSITFRVKDSATPDPAYDQCTVDIVVKVDPTIQER